MPRWIAYLAIVLVTVALIPLALIARARAVTSSEPRVHLIFDMDNQAKFRAQASNPLFADGRAMRAPVDGTVRFGDGAPSTALTTGRVGEEWVGVNPLPVALSVLRRGQERYDVFCAPCHGLSGYGNGPVAARADALQEGTWTPPSSFHTELVRGRPDGHLYNTIANGIRNMPAYGSQIPVEDRWAIVAYMRALQRSQNATVDDVPADVLEELTTRAGQVR